MQREGYQEVIPGGRWGSPPKGWPIAPHYQIVDVLSQRKEGSRHFAKRGWQLRFDPLPDIERQGLLVEHDEVRTTWEQREAEYYHHYDPLAVPGLPSELAALHEGNHTAMLKFAHKRGLLGYGCLKEPLKEALEPEPLAWIWAHAETVRRVLKLIRLLRDQDKQLGEYLESIAEHVPQAGSAFETKWRQFAPLFPAEYVTNVFFSHAQDRDSNQYVHWDIEGVGRSITALDSQEQREIAWHVVCRSINSNVERVFPQLATTDYSGAHHQFQYPALITAVYLHLYDIAAGRTDIGECVRCGSFFPLPRDRAGPKPCYCPRTDDTTGESYCSLRIRKERWQKKQKESVNGEAQG
jgi:hypothetical protein